MTKRKVMIHILTSRLTLGRAIFDADEDALEEMEEGEIPEEEEESLSPTGELPEPTELIMEGRLITGKDRVELVWE